MEKFVEEHGLELVGANFFFAENGGMCRKEVEGERREVAWNRYRAAVCQGCRSELKAK